MKRDFGRRGVAARNRHPRRCAAEPLEKRYLLILFGPPSVFPSGNPSAFGVAAEDFNHDGNLDGAIGGVEVAVLLGDGAGDNQASWSPDSRKLAAKTKAQPRPPPRRL